LAAFGPLAQWLEIASAGGWDTSAEHGTYVMINTEKPGAVRYYFVEAFPGDTVKVKVTTTVSIPATSAQMAGAGLIYSFDRQTKTYVAVTIQPGDAVVTYIRDDKGFREVMRSSTTGLLKPGMNEVTILGNGKSMAMLVNGQAVGTLTNEMLSPNKGSGIVALGIGTFAFGGYSADRVQ
jgi:hypothetical protein